MSKVSKAIRVVFGDAPLGDSVDIAQLQDVLERLFQSDAKPQPGKESKTDGEAKQQETGKQDTPKPRRRGEKPS